MDVHTRRIEQQWSRVFNLGQAQPPTTLLSLLLLMHSAGGLRQFSYMLVAVEFFLCLAYGVNVRHHHSTDGVDASTNLAVCTTVNREPSDSSTGQLNVHHRRNTVMSIP